MKNEIDDIIGSFVNKRLSDKIKEVLTSNKSAIVLDFNDIDQFSPELGDHLLKNPEETIDTIKYFVNEMSVPHKELDIAIRIKNLPKNAQMLIREIRSKHIGLFIQIQGLIKTAASVKPVASSIDFECQSCGHITKVEQKEMTQRAPSICTNCGKKGRFKIAKKYLVDTQRIMLEEAPEDLEGGEQPEHINVVLKKDLVDPKFERNIIPGNKVVVSGIINESAIYYPSGKRSNTSDTFLLASYVEAVEQGYEDIIVTKEEELAIKELANDKMIYSKFKNSIAPNIFGHDNIKEAIVMQLFGGVRKASASGNSVIRGDIHILLVGDPGTSKSSLLKYVTGIAPKARYVVGMGSSAAGLTATIIKDEATRSYILEAGALPLTNKGLLMIDELDKMNKDDRVAMHEALEQQSYSYDSKLLLSDGSEVKIGELVDKYMTIDKKHVTKGNSCEILDAKELNLKILTTDFNKIFETRAFQLSRHKSKKKMIRIKLQNGRELTVTPEHPVWVFENGRFETIPAQDLKKQMQVPIPSFLPVSGIDQGMPIEATAINNKLVHNDSSFCRWMGYLLTDGSYELNRGIKNGVNFTNTDISLIKDFYELTHKIFGIKSYVQIRKPKIIKDKYVSKTCYFVRATSKSIVLFLNALDSTILEKSNRKKIPDLLMRTSNKNISELLKAMFEGDGFATKNRIGLVSSCKEKIEQVNTLLLRFGINSTIYEEKLPSGKSFYKLTITGIKNLIKFKENIGFLSEKKNNTLLQQVAGKNTSTSRNDSINGVGNVLSDIARKLRVKPSTVVPQNINDVISSRKFIKAVTRLNEKTTEIQKAESRLFSDKNLSMEDLIKIRQTLKISCLDLGNNSEVSGSLINYWENKKIEDMSRSHPVYQKETIYRNALIKIINEMKEAIEAIKPLSDVAFGDIGFTKIKKIEKVKYENEWVYDVGVMPTHTLIVNGAVAHNSISISKANIHATLTAQTSVLAAANPKLGRFNPFDVISSQIELPPTLINRFDLIFILKDRPDKEMDALIAQRILEANRDINKNKPEIPPNIMKKYIAYAKQNIKPKMSMDAIKIIEEFYLKLRSQYSTEGEEVKPIPISARQLEAIVRLTEASAKVRLSEYATLEDAKRAVDLMMSYLSDVGVDSSTGQLDIDRIITGMPSSQRNTVLTVKSMIKSETDSMPMGSSVPLSKIYEDAEKAGIDTDKVDSAISILKREGEIFEPKPSFIKLL